MSRRGGNHVGMSFVDTLTCGIGAIVLLWMAQLSQPQPEPRFGGTGTVLTVAVDPKADGARPLLAVRLQRAGGSPQPASVVGPSFGVTADPPHDGADEYRLTFNRDATFAADDRLLVYLFDLNGRRFDQAVAVTAERVRPGAAGRQSCGPRPDLFPSGTAPLLTLPLADAEGQTGLMTWRLRSDGRRWPPFADPPANPSVPPKGDRPKKLDAPYRQEFAVEMPDLRGGERGHHERYRFSAEWDVAPLAEADQRHRATSADQLGLVGVVLGENERAANAITLDGHDKDPAAAALARQVLAFFWNEFPPTPPPGADPDPPRFDLAPQGKVGRVIGRYSSFPLAVHCYRLPTNGPVVLAHPGLRHALELLFDAGATGGQVQLLAEDGQPPERFVLVHRPGAGDPWRGGTLVSPGLRKVYPLRAAEPLAPVGAADGRMRGLGRLPKGTWEVLERVEREGGSLLAFGPGGLVTAAAEHTPPFVWHARRAADNQLVLRHTSGGLTDPTDLPAWADVLPPPAVRLTRPTSGPARDVIALAACSRQVWSTPRPTDADPGAKAEANRPLPLHPELWAFPPAPPTR